MAVETFGSTDETLRPHTRAFVIYDRTTGEVLHVHRSVSFSNNPPAREEPEVRARQLARNISSNAEVIEVDAKEIDQRQQTVRVNVATGRLVAIKARASGKRKKSSGRRFSGSRRSSSVKQSKRRKR
jgi:hypothetical protein